MECLMKDNYQTIGFKIFHFIRLNERNDMRVERGRIQTNIQWRIKTYDSYEPIPLRDDRTKPTKNELHP